MKEEEIKTDTGKEARGGGGYRWINKVGCISELGNRGFRKNDGIRHTSNRIHR